MTSIDKKLQVALDKLNNKQKKAVLTVAETFVEDNEQGGDVSTEAWDYTDEFKKELERRSAAVENGSSKLISAGESKRRVQKLLR